MQNSFQYDIESGIKDDSPVIVPESNIISNIITDNTTDNTTNVYAIVLIDAESTIELENTQPQNAQPDNLNNPRPMMGLYCLLFDIPAIILFIVLICIYS